MASLIGCRSCALGQLGGVCDTGAIWQLEDHLKACISSRDYGAAQHVEAQLVELKQQQERHALESLAAQQAEERAANEAAYAQARQELTYRWQERMAQMQDTMMQQQQQMMARHEEETANLLAAQMTTPARPRFTPQLLNMRRVEAMLAEQKHFAKANKVKQQADQQELLELQCFDADKLSKWELERAGLAAQHTREQAAADKKVTSALLEAQVVQQQELEQLTRRFQAAQLAMSRNHAAQQLKAAASLRGTLGLPKPSQHLMNLPSFNTSLVPPRGLVAALPLNPAETCRPAHLFQESLTPAPCIVQQAARDTGLQQSLMPTLLANTQGYMTQAGNAYAPCKAGAGQGLGPMASSSSVGSSRTGLSGSRGPSPMRASPKPAPNPYINSNPTPRARNAADNIHAWGGGSILSSSGGPSQGSSPLLNPLNPRGVSMSSQQALGQSPGGKSRGCSPARNGSQQHQGPSNSSSSSMRAASPSKGGRNQLNNVWVPAGPVSPPQPAAPTTPTNSTAMNCGRAASPGRMPHPPCQPSGSSSRPCSPAVRMRAPSPQTRLGNAGGNAPPQSPLLNMMAPSNDRFHSPSRARRSAGQAAQTYQMPAGATPAGPKSTPPADAGNLMSRAQQIQHHVSKVAPAAAAAAAPAATAGAALGAGRLSDAMGTAPVKSSQQQQQAATSSVSAKQPAALSPQQQQWMGQKVQRVESMINALSDEAMGLQLDDFAVNGSAAEGVVPAKAVLQEQQRQQPQQPAQHVTAAAGDPAAEQQQGHADTGFQAPAADTGSAVQEEEVGSCVAAAAAAVSAAEAEAGTADDSCTSADA